MKNRNDMNSVPLCFRKAPDLTPDQEIELEELQEELDQLIQGINGLKRGRPISMSEFTENFAKQCSFVKTSTGECFVRLWGSRRYQLLEINGKNCELASLLGVRYYGASGKFPSSHSISESMRYLKDLATIDGTLETIHVRVANVGDEIWIDLNDQSGHVALVNKSGNYIRRNDTPHFRRQVGMLPLPLPIEGGSIEMLRKFFHFGDDDTFMLLVGWLIGAFAGRSCAHLVIYGEQGSAKTTTLKLLRLLVDPNVAMTRPFPSGQETLLIAAQNSYILSFDNLGRLTNKMADSICRLATGDAFSRRRLYSDKDETLISVQRPCILNSIADMSDRSDLLDRCVVVRLPRIRPSDRRSETAIEREFLEKRPYILGAIYSVLSYALAHQGEYEIETPPRLIDFANFVEAAAPALGWRRGDFTRAFLLSQENESVADLDSSPISLALIKMIETTGPVHKTPSDLHATLSKYFKDPYTPLDWPKTPEMMSREFQKMQSAFRKVGIEVIWTRGTQRWIIARKINRPEDMD